MTDLRKAAEMALKALEELDGLDTETECVTIYVTDEIEALRQALAQPEQANPIDTYERAYYEGKRAGIAESEAIKTQSEQEPVAWLHPDRKIDVIVPSKLAWFDKPIPLYTAPPKQVWRGLTDEERVQAFVDAGLELAYMDYDADMKISKVIEAKLKEKNT